MTDTRKWDFGQIINRREILGFEPTKLLTHRHHGLESHGSTCRRELSLT